MATVNETEPYRETKGRLNKKNHNPQKSISELSDFKKGQWIAFVIYSAEGMPQHYNLASQDASLPNPFLDPFPVYLSEECPNPGPTAQGPQICPYYPVDAFPNCTSSIPCGASYGLEYWSVALTLRITHPKAHNPTIFHLPSTFSFPSDILLQVIFFCILIL